MRIPELQETDQADSDVEVSFGSCPAHLHPSTSSAWIEYQNNECLIKIPGVARYHVFGSESIVIDRRTDRSRERGDGRPSSDIRLYLLGTAFAAIIYQGGLLPLHVGAVQAESGTWAFTGESGAGKSTLVAFLNRAFRLPIVTDDVAVITPSSGPVFLNSGPRRVKLWKNSMEALGYPYCERDKDLTGHDKYQVTLPVTDINKRKPLVALVELARASAKQRSGIIELSGVAAFSACSRALYRPMMAQTLMSPNELFAGIVDLGQQIKVYRFTREWCLSSIEQQCHSLIEIMNVGKATKASE